MKNGPQKKTLKKIEKAHALIARGYTQTKAAKTAGISLNTFYAHRKTTTPKTRKKTARVTESAFGDAWLKTAIRESVKEVVEKWFGRATS